MTRADDDEDPQRIGAELERALRESEISADDLQAILAMYGVEVTVTRRGVSLRRTTKELQRIGFSPEPWGYEYAAEVFSRVLWLLLGLFLRRPSRFRALVAADPGRKTARKRARQRKNASPRKRPAKRASARASATPTKKKTAKKSSSAKKKRTKGPKESRRR